MNIPCVRQYMTLVPKAITVGQSLGQASEYMRKLHVRHLPVLKAGNPVGVISDRDIHLAINFNELDALAMPVEVALTPDPFFTTPETPISEVAALMAERKFDWVLVMDRERLVGIFTAVDALRAVADILRECS